MKTLQRCSDVNALRRYSIDGLTKYPIEDVELNHEWQASNASVIIGSSRPYTNTHYTLEIAPNTNIPVVVNIPLDTFIESDDIGSIFVFTGVFYSETDNISISAKLYDRSNTEITAGTTTTIQAGIWGAARSNQLQIVEPSGVFTSFYHLEITIQNHNQRRVRMSTPNLVNDAAWLENPVIASMKPYIPNFYVEFDALQENPRYPMFRFIDVLTDAIADTMFLYSDWYEYEERELPRGVLRTDKRMLSKLTNPFSVREENKQWLAQFSGSKTRNQIYLYGSGIIPEENIEEFRRWQFDPAGYGRASGTQQAIRDAVQFVLTGEKIVIVSQISGGDPWTISLITLISESPPPDVILAAAEPARPMGYQITHTAVDEINLVLGDPIYGRLGSARL